jgi:starch synthase
VKHFIADAAGATPDVLILSIEYPPRAGAGTHVFELAHGLVEFGCNVSILAPTSGEQGIRANTPIKEILVRPSAATCASAAHLSRVQGVLAVNNDLIEQGGAFLARQAEKPALIHCHDWYAFPAAQALSKRFAIPVVGTAHSTSEPIVRWWGQLPDEEVVRQEKALYFNADSLITVSHSMGRIIQAAHGLPDTRISIVHNGLNVAPFMHPTANGEAIAKMRRSVAAWDEKIIIYAGRLTPQKGISALFAAASQVIKEMPKAKYLIAGEADSLESSKMLKSLTAKYPDLRNRVKLLGRLSRKQLALLYQVADIAVVPSIYEPFGYAAIEAMSAGVPVIATNGGGFLEIIEHGKTGLLVNVRENGGGLRAVEVDELIAAQLNLLSDSVRARELGRAGQQHAVTTFSVERMVRATVAVYQRALQQ